MGGSGAPMRGIVARGEVFLSGVIATGTRGEIVGAGALERQAQQAFSNLKAFLARAGASPEDVVKMTIYLCNGGAYHLAAGALAEFLGGHQPALTVVGVTRLVNPEALIEVDATAMLPDSG